MSDWKEGNNIPLPSTRNSPHYGPNLLPSNILMQALLFSFFWIISLSQAYLFSLHFCLFSSFSFFRIFLHPPSLALIRSILSTLFHSLLTSHPLSLSHLSPVSTLSLHVASSFHIPQVLSSRFGWGEGGGQHLISYLRINHEVLSTQSSSDPSASLSASSGSLIQTQARTTPPPTPHPCHTHTAHITPHHWQMAVGAPVRSTTDFHPVTTVRSECAVLHCCAVHKKPKALIVISHGLV